VVKGDPHSASCSLGSSARFRRSFLCRLPYVLGALHHLLSQLLGLIAEHLSLATNEVALDLSEFLRFSDTNHFVTKVERIGYCLLWLCSDCCQSRALVTLMDRLHLGLAGLVAASICFARRRDARVFYSGRCSTRNSLTG
jgi:hypothetical protein